MPPAQYNEFPFMNDREQSHGTLYAADVCQSSDERGNCVVDFLPILLGSSEGLGIANFGGRRREPAGLAGTSVCQWVSLCVRLRR